MPASLETTHLANLHDEVHPELRGYLIAGLSLRLGDTVTARKYLAELETPGRTRARATVARDAAGSIRAQAERLAGRAPDAARDLEEVLRLEARVGLIGGSPFYSQGLERFLYAAVLAGEGRQQEANLWYDSFSSNAIFDLIYLAPSHLERGRIADKLGQPTQALHHYQQAVALWLNCDPELRSLPNDARARIETLKASTAAKRDRGASRPAGGSGPPLSRGALGVAGLRSRAAGGAAGGGRGSAASELVAGSSGGEPRGGLPGSLMIGTGTVAESDQRLLQNPVRPGRVTGGEQCASLNQPRLAHPGAPRLGERVEGRDLACLPGVLERRVRPTHR
jgi:hypothetical protein